MRPGPEHIGTTGAAAGDFLGYDPDADEYAPMVPPGGGGITGLTSDDASVTITDNGDGTLDLAAAGGGGGGTTSGELLMADGVTSPPIPIETEAGDDWLYQD